jgi:hypothetical protein
MLVESRIGDEISMSEDKLEEVVRDPAVEHAANVFHYLVVHANVKQYYYELKYVRDDRRLMDLIGKSLKELDTLKRSEDHKDTIAKLLIPSNEDLAKTLEHYRRFRERFTAALAAMTVASCKLCWAERGQ